MNSTEITQNKRNKNQQYIPQKFVFDFEDEDDTDDSEEMLREKIVNFSKIEPYLPKLMNFEHPLEFAKENYQKICERIISIYNRIRDKLLENFIEDLEKVIQKANIEGPIEVLLFFDTLISKSYDLLIDHKEINKNIIGEYEKLLQKSEGKIRDFIRNEQIYKLNFDAMTLKGEENERLIKDLQEKLDISKKSLKDLSTDNQKLVLILKKQEEEILRLKEEFDATIDKLNSSQTLTQDTISTEKPKISLTGKNSSNIWDRDLKKDTEQNTPSDMRYIFGPKYMNKTPTPSRMTNFNKPSFFDTNSSIASLKNSISIEPKKPKTNPVRESFEKQNQTVIVEKSSSIIDASEIIYGQENSRAKISRLNIQEKILSTLNDKENEKEEIFPLSQNLATFKNIVNNRYGSIDPKNKQTNTSYGRLKNIIEFDSQVSRKRINQDKLNKSVVGVKARTEHSPENLNRSLDQDSRFTRIRAVDFFNNKTKISNSDDHNQIVSRSYSSIRNQILGRQKK